MRRFINGLFDRISAFFGALTFSQAPAFMQDYQQQLSGHVSELQIQVEAIRTAAKSSGKSLEEFIKKFQDSPDLDYALGGQIMQEMVERYKHLLEAYNALLQTNVFDRPFVFARYFDKNLAEATYQNYQFSLPFTVEGFIYAMVGLLLGVILYYVISRTCIFCLRPLFRRKPVS